MPEVSAAMSKNDFQTIRSFLRWEGMGVRNSVTQAKLVAEVVNNYDVEQLAKVKEAVDHTVRGLMVSPEALKAAQNQLQQVWDRQTAGDDMDYVERDHG